MHFTLFPVLCLLLFAINLGATNNYYITAASNSFGYLHANSITANYITALIGCTGCGSAGSGFTIAGTGLTGTGGSTVSLLPLTPGTGISIGANGNTIAATGYNSFYDNILTSYFPYNNLKAGAGISISTNTITATGYNSFYLTSTYNGIYDSNSLSYSKFYSTLGASNDIRFNLATNTITDLPPYNSAYWTGTSYNSFYQAILNNYVPSISAGTGISIAFATNTITALPSYNSFYDNLLLNYFPYNTLKVTNDLKLTGNTLALTVNMLYTYNSAYLTTSWNAQALNAISPITISTSNTVVCSTCLTSPTAIATTLQGNVIGNNAVFTNLYGSIAGTNSISAGTISGTTLTMNDIYFNTITPNNGFTTVASNIIATNIISFNNNPTTTTNGLALFTSNNAVAQFDSAFWLVYPVIQSTSTTVSTFAEVFNTVSAGLTNQVAFNVPIVGASNSCGEIIIPYSFNVAFQYGGGVTLVSANIIKLK